MPFGDALSEAVADVGPPGAMGSEKKNYTEKISAALTTLVAARLRELGLREARAPQRGRDKQFMGGYGTASTPTSPTRSTGCSFRREPRHPL